MPLTLSSFSPRPEHSSSPEHSRGLHRPVAGAGEAGPGASTLVKTSAPQGARTCWELERNQAGLSETSSGLVGERSGGQAGSAQDSGMACGRGPGLPLQGKANSIPGQPSTVNLLPSRREKRHRRQRSLKPAPSPSRPQNEAHTAGRNRNSQTPHSPAPPLPSSS